MLTAAEEAEKVGSPRSRFAECANGCPTMVVIPAGKFMMGSPEGAGDADEHPQHAVAIRRPFAVSETEITFAQWDACVNAGGCQKIGDNTWGRGDRPAILMSWQEAKEYAAWLSKLTDKQYRLLTEAEWEYAARAGNQGKWSFGDQEGELGKYAWFGMNSETKTQPVRKKKPNAFGLYDMHGNVWEWTEDCWNSTYAAAPTDGKAWLKGDCGQRVLRGGSWNYSPDVLRSSERYAYTSDSRVNFLGFRLARTLDP